MLRSILGGIVGYVAMFVLIFVLFSAAYLTLGADRAFMANSYQLSMTWHVISWVLGLVAAIAAGYIAALVGKGQTAVKVLAGIILVMGLLTVVMMIATPPNADIRTADVSNMEAMAKAQMPIWTGILNPILSIIGALIGGKLRK